jgi:uncharacterized membrane protein YesL
MNRISFETFHATFGLVYLLLVTNLLLVGAAAPLVALAVSTDPARSWPLLAVAAAAAAPGAAAAFRAFSEHSRGAAGAAPFLAFARGYRDCWRHALAVGGLTAGTLTVLLVDVRALAASTAGVLVTPLLAVLCVLALGVGAVSLVVVAEAPQARIRDVLRASGYLAVRRWYLTAASLVACGVQLALFTQAPALALGVTAAPALYVAWANSRYTLRPVLAVPEATE